MKIKEFIELIQRDDRLNENDDIWISLDNANTYLSPDVCFHFGVIDACDKTRNLEGKHDLLLKERLNGMGRI